MEARTYNKRMDIVFECKVADLYKFCAEGWSVAMAENKAGLGIGTKDFEYYKESEHYLRVRKVYAKKPTYTYRSLSR